MSTNSPRFKTPGQRYGDFELTRVVEISELQCTLRELIHLPSGARVMQIANEDAENLFCLSFQTIPKNSNGVAHILEHTVLCGSKKFPAKDPFFSMQRRSLNTFMNALTGSDFTCYPASTQLKKDFYNLLEVYLDAVFYPNLKKFSFLQEGHRLEFQIEDNPETPLEYKGIVYNEMKGALASSGARLAEAINEALFPNITYGYNSGGDPKDIPSLTYEQLKEFHEMYYHPSRCLFFFYGNLPLEGHLDFIETHALKQAKMLPPFPKIPLQKRFKAPVKKEMTYPIAAEENPLGKTLVSFSWLTCTIFEQEEALALSILEIILMDTDASLLKKDFLGSGLCKQATAFIDTEIQEIPWGITLKGCDPECVDQLETILFESLCSICRRGIPLQTIENAIHQLEFHRSEITGDHAPFGLSLFMRSALLKQHGVDPSDGLKIHSLFDHLRKKTVADPHYFTNLIQKYLIENPHFVRIVMKPDPGLEEKETKEELMRLEAIKASLTDKQKKDILKQAEELASFQQEQEEDEESIELLPKVLLSDIPAYAKDYILKEEEYARFKVYHHKEFTNHIVYTDIVFALPQLSEAEFPLLRLLTVMLTQMACGGRSYIENLDFIQGNTGGVGAGISLNLNAKCHTDFNPVFYLKGKALQNKTSALFSLMRDLLTEVKFSDLKRFKEVLLKHFTGLESSINQSALKYAVNLSASKLNPASYVAECLYGLTYYSTIRRIVLNFDEEGRKTLDALKALYEKISAISQFDLVLSCDQQTFDTIKGNHFYGLEELKAHSSSKWKSGLKSASKGSEGKIIASPVAFIAKVFETVSYIDSFSPALSLAAHLFDNLTLHPLIREKGGAYGGGAVSNPVSGNFYFYSYRDPNIVSTLDAFEQAIKVIVEGDFSESDLEEAKFEMIQSLDAPISPGSRGEVAHARLLEGRTLEMRQTFRQELLNLGKKKLIEAVKTVIVPSMKKASVVVFASKELLERANQELKEKGKPPLSISSI